MKDRSDVPPIEDHEAKLERAFEDEFLRQTGQTRAEVLALPEPERTVILRDAAAYASSRLAEVEARAHYVNDFASRALIVDVTQCYTDRLLTRGGAAR